jgi:putative tricarboxylic transport membrane protein
MSEHGQEAGRSVGGWSTGTVEAIVAAMIFSVGVVVIRDSERLGAGWGPDGPESGYFPFYIVLLICLSTAATMVQALFGRLARTKVFVEGAQLRQMLSVLVPAAVYIGLIHPLGVYVASATYIAFFMLWLGEYAIARALPVGVSVSVLLFLMFEKWFAVPLPKGPIERMLGC